MTTFYHPDDLRSFTYIKRWIRKYVITGQINSRVLLNLVITIYNVFGDLATGMLYDHLEKEPELLALLKSLLLVADVLPVTFKIPVHTCYQNSYFPHCGCTAFVDCSLSEVVQDEAFQARLIEDIRPTLKKQSSNFIVG